MNGSAMLDVTLAQLQAGAQQPAVQLSAALAVLSAMITPAVLILASSSLIAATSTRLGRILERCRRLADQCESLLKESPLAGAQAEKYDLLVDQLQMTARRALLLQRAMTALYAALGSFVATSIALGIDAALRQGHTTVLIVLGLIGAGFLLYASVLLVAESRIAISAVHREMELVRRLAKHKGERPPAAAKGPLSSEQQPPGA